VIAGDTEFDGEILVTGPIQADGGVNGNTAGTHIGPVTGNLTGNSVGTHTGAHVGPVDVRGQALQLDDAQITQAKIAGLTAAIAGSLPIGMIMFWYGDETSIPAGWHLCDGTMGTPDSRGRFIRAAFPGTIPALSNAGSNTHSHTLVTDAAGVHTHALTINDTAISVAQMPPHNHKSGTSCVATDLFSYGSAAVPASTTRSISISGDPGTVQSLTSDVGSGLGHNHGASAANSAAHTHNATTAVVDNIPAFQAFIMIMKIT
jgi:hypothetical protein